MYEYVFFDQGLCDKFTRRLDSESIDYQCDREALLVGVSEAISERQAEQLDDFYERLLQENAELLEGTEDALEKNTAGVRVVLGDGSPCMVRLDPDLMARMLNCISLEELRDMVQTIATSVENPDDRPLCHT